MFVNHNDPIKNLGPLIININKTQFRIFLTDRQIICFTSCKSTGRTNPTCKTNPKPIKVRDRVPYNSNYMITNDSIEIESPISIKNKQPPNILLLVLLSKPRGMK